MKFDILIMEENHAKALFLERILKTYDFTSDVARINPSNTLNFLEKYNFNLIIVNPFAYNLKSTSKIIFKIREVYPNIVFVLYYDVNNSELQEKLFKEGSERFKHYFKLNKKTPFIEFERELLEVINACKSYVTNQSWWKLKNDTIKNKKNEVIGLHKQINSFIMNDDLE